MAIDLYDSKRVGTSLAAVRERSPQGAFLLNLERLGGLLMLNRRTYLKTLAAAALVSGSLTLSIAHAADTIKVGVLHSLSGTMAISETVLKDTVLMAIDEINA